MNKNMLRLTYSAICIALALVLPFFLGQVQIFMQGISPMHIPALLAGFLCGPWWGLAVGFICPILRSLLFSMPPMPVVAVPMAFELAAYGFFAGFLYYRVFKKLKFWPRTYISMVISMVSGRIIGGIAKAVVIGISGEGYGFKAFVTGYFFTTAVGAVLHLIVVPIIFFALLKASLVPGDRG